MSLERKRILSGGDGDGGGCDGDIDGDDVVSSSECNGAALVSGGILVIFFSGF